MDELTQAKCAEEEEKRVEGRTLKAEGAKLGVGRYLGVVSEGEGKPEKAEEG